MAEKKKEEGKGLEFSNDVFDDAAGPANDKPWGRSYEEFDPGGPGYDAERGDELKMLNPLTIPKPTSPPKDPSKGATVAQEGGAHESWVWHPEKGDWKRHGGSRDPESGQALKGFGYGTFNLYLEGEEDLGYDVYKDPETGKYFSHPSGGAKALELEKRGFSLVSPPTEKPSTAEEKEDFGFSNDVFGDAAGSVDKKAEENSYYGYKTRPPFAGEDSYFKANPGVGGMAAEDDQIVLNPYSKLKPDEMEQVARNEGLRIYMRQSGESLDFELTPEQSKSFEGTAYGEPANSEQAKQTIISRILTGDPSAGNATAIQKKVAEKVLAGASANEKKEDVALEMQTKDMIKKVLSRGKEQP